MGGAAPFDSAYQPAGAFGQHTLPPPAPLGASLDFFRNLGAFKAPPGPGAPPASAPAMLNQFPTSASQWNPQLQSSQSHCIPPPPLFQQQQQMSFQPPSAPGGYQQ